MLRRLLAKVMPAYGFEMDAVVSVHQLVSNAIVLDGQIGSEPGTETPAEERVATA